MTIRTGRRSLRRAHRSRCSVGNRKIRASGVLSPWKTGSNENTLPSRRSPRIGTQVIECGRGSTRGMRIGGDREADEDFCSSRSQRFMIGNACESRPNRDASVPATALSSQHFFGLSAAEP